MSIVDTHHIRYSITHVLVSLSFFVVFRKIAVMLSLTCHRAVIVDNRYCFDSKFENQILNWWRISSLISDHHDLIISETHCMSHGVNLTERDHLIDNVHKLHLSKKNSIRGPSWSRSDKFTA